MKRYALCLSGRPYGLAECAPSIIENIIIPNNCDVFIFAWHDEQLAGTRYKAHPEFPGLVPSNGKKKILDLYKPKSYCITEPQQFSTDGFDSTYQPGDKYFIEAIQSMNYSTKQAISFAISHARHVGFEYDGICRSRFDLKYTKPVLFDDLDMSKLNIRGDCRHEPGCCNDHFAVANQTIMGIYADLYPEMYKMYAYGTPWCNEVFLGRWMKWNNIEIVPFEPGYNQWK